MNKIFLYGALVFLLSCNNNSGNPGKPQPIPADTASAVYKFDCFQSVDTTQKMETIACGNYFYKIIGKQYVLRLKITIPVQYDSCVQLRIDTTNTIAELIVYKDGEANLFPYCNDYGNGIIPLRTLAKAYGDIYIRFYKPTEYRGTDDPTASIFVHQLVFKDSHTGSPIGISNELYWKVFQFGPAG